MGPLETLVREMFDVIINKGDVDRVEEYVMPGYISHTPQGPMDVEAFKDYVRAWRNGFPDIHCDVYEVVEVPDHIAWRVWASGTHTGEFMGIPPTGRLVDFDSMNFAHARNGKATEHHVLMDLAAMMEQLGTPASESQNADLVKSGYDAFAAQDVPAVMAVFDRNIAWSIPDTIPIIGGRYDGADAVMGFFSKLMQVYSELRVEPDTFIASGDDVVVRGHLRGTVAASGRTFDVLFAHCWTVQDELATSFMEYSDTAAFAALLAQVPQQEIRVGTPTPTLRA